METRAGLVEVPTRPDLSCFTISIVVPVFNSAPTLVALVDAIESALAGTLLRYELILVNDGSADGSWEVIQELATRTRWVRGLNLMRNYGQHAALLCGIRAARNDVIVTIDDDLQNPPEEIPRLLDELRAGFDVVYGKPREEKHGLLRDFASRLTKLGLERATGSAAARNVSAFRAFRTPVRDAFRHYDAPFVSIDVLLTWGTKRFSAVAVEHRERVSGQSHYSVRKLIQHAVDLTTGFSTLPLRIATFVGFVFTFFGFAVLAYVLCRYLIEGGSVPGFPFLASTIAIFSGAQLFALGVMGEYIARMHIRSMGAPSAVVRDKVGFN